MFHVCQLLLLTKIILIIIYGLVNNVINTKNNKN